VCNLCLLGGPYLPATSEKPNGPKRRKDRAMERNAKDNGKDAIEMLKAQHREVETLFKKFEGLGESATKTKQSTFDQIADALAMHATIEERHFYPAVKAKRTEDILLEALEEHLGIKRVIADLLKIDASDDTFDAKVKVLKEQVEHHVEEEESDLFPKVKKVLDKDELTELGATMQQTMRVLMEKGEARKAVPAETRQAPSL
jgi:hemerythrin superfamily protein